MKCIKCGKKSRVIDSRHKSEGTYRRRGCSDGHKWTTIEIGQDEYDLLWYSQKQLAQIRLALRVALDL